MTAPGWRRTAVSLFSIIGFATVAQAAYGIISAPLGFYVGKWTEVPSYIRNGVCGEGTPYRCPGPDVPCSSPAPRSARPSSSVPPPGGRDHPDGPTGLACPQAQHVAPGVWN